MSDPRSLCSRAAELAAQFPGRPVDVDPAANIGTVMTSYWNVAIPRAAGLLAKALIDMASRRMTETVLVRRALMELYANLAVLNLDPTNAIRFSLEQFVSNERMLGKIQEHGIGTADELAVKSSQLDEARAQLEGHGLNPDDVTRYEPFGMKTRDRFEAAGLHDAYYEVLYSIASEYAHMNGEPSRESSTTTSGKARRTRSSPLLPTSSSEFLPAPTTSSGPTSAERSSS